MDQDKLEMPTLHTNLSQITIGDLKIFDLEN